jgi:TolA-binding protein
MIYAKYQRAIIEGLERRPDAKIRQLEQMKTDHPDSDLADDVLMQLGITYLETGRGAQALPVFQALLEDYPNSPLYVAALLRLGLISYNSGNTDAALRYYKQVFNHRPGPSEGREALSALEEIYVRDLKTPDTYFAFVNSVPGYEITALKKDSISYRVAEIQYEQAQYPEAVKAFTEYLERYPNGIYVISAYFYRGDAHGILNSYTAALSDFDQVVRRGQSPYYLDALQRAAVLSYNHTHDFPAAFKYYQSLKADLVDATKRFDADLGLLRSAYRSGYHEETLKSAEMIIAHQLATDAMRGEAHYYAARTSYDQKAYEKALDHFNQVATYGQNEQTAEARYRIAEIYYLRGNASLAEQLCHKANEQNANYPVWVARSLILLSDIALGRQDFFNAKAPLEAVIENFDRDPEILKEARDKLERVLALEKEHSRIQQDNGASIQFQHEDDGKNN